MIPLRFGDVRVELHDGYTKTVFPDGKELHALHKAQEGQAETARDLGYGNDVEALNRDHDLAHCIFSYTLGMPFSGSLYAAAARMKPTDINWLEEAAVLAMQTFARAQGIDLLLVARKITAQSEL